MAEEEENELDRWRRKRTGSREEVLRKKGKTIKKKIG